MSKRLMRIGQVAERTGLSLPTLRHYDETGLLSPSARTSGNFRMYSEADYERLMVIRRMKPLGFTLEEMRQLLVIVDGLRRPPAAGGRQAVPQLLEQLQAFVEDARRRREQLRLQLERADEFIRILLKEEAGVPQRFVDPAWAEPEDELTGAAVR